RRELIAHQRREMAQVASAADHLARTAGALGERGAEARRLAHMEESRAETRTLVNVAATLAGGMSVMSEDAGRALEQLAWLDGQAAAASDSFAVLTVLVKERGEEVSRGVPTLWPVRGGQSVRRGQAVGAVGATGRAAGAHLHYEVRVNGAPVDPRRYLGK